MASNISFQVKLLIVHVEVAMQFKHEEQSVRDKLLLEEMFDLSFIHVHCSRSVRIELTNVFGVGCFLHGRSFQCTWALRLVSTREQ